jgi:hypothetical protein
MLLRLEAVTFNHDTSSAAADAINIRKNETELVTLPEWRREVCVNPEHSPAAYALDETRGKRLAVKAAFSCADGDTSPLEVRALDARLHPRSGRWSGLTALLSRPGLRKVAGNVLGEVAAKRIGPCRGGTGLETFELKNVRIWDAGVGVHDVVWRWQYRLAGGRGWRDFAASAHRIYTVLAVPTLPWMQDSDDPHSTLLPWAEALDRACFLAAGAKDPDAAAALITRGVNELDSKVVRYAGSAHYTDDRRFDCQAFLERLRGMEGNGRKVNCDDCAAAVSTFANLLGCGLSQMSIVPMNESFIGLKPIIKIGIPGWREEDEFDRHAVASEGSCRETDEVFDACVRVAAFDEPDPSKRVPLLATNLRFGLVGEYFYRRRLALPDFEEKCGPDPEVCRRVEPGSARRLAAHSEVQLKAVKERHEFQTWKLVDAPGVRRYVFEYFFADYVLPGRRPLQFREFARGEEAAEQHVIQSFWEGAPCAGDNTLRIDVFECASWRQAREGVAALLTWFQEPGMLRREVAGLGDVVFADDSFGTVLSATGNLVFFLRNVGDETVSLAEVTEALNASVLNPPPGTVVTPEHGPAEAGMFRFESGETEVGYGVPLEREGADPLSRRRLYQFFSDDAELSWQDGRLVYRPASSGLHTLRVFAIDAHGDALTQELRLQVR